MREGEGLPPIRSIRLGNTPLFADVTSGTGSEERKLADGTVVIATVEDGKIVGYSARDRDGKPLSVVRLSMTSGAPRDGKADDPAARESCWFCFCDDTHCQCTPERCPDPPV